MEGTITIPNLRSISNNTPQIIQFITLVISINKLETGNPFLLVTNRAVSSENQPENFWLKVIGPESHRASSTFWVFRLQWRQKGRRVIRGILWARADVICFRQCTQEAHPKAHNVRDTSIYDCLVGWGEHNTQTVFSKNLMKTKKESERNNDFNWSKILSKNELYCLWELQNEYREKTSCKS